MLHPTFLYMWEVGVKKCEGCTIRYLAVRILFVRRMVVRRENI